MEPLSLLLGAGGFVLGLAADRLATRWPEHDEEHPPGRAVDWRTATVALVGALAFGLLPIRFSADPVAFVIFGAWFVTLVIGLATDLDQRLLPDVLTLPVIPVALVYALTGANPLVGNEIILAIVAAVAIPALLYLPSIPFGAGAFGLGDVKLLIGVGLLVGGSRALGSVFVALLLAGVVLGVLLATHRIGRRTYIPFGPFFIAGALWAVLIRA
jgi:leader peptidase (prepilin peptidase)/N-methyltransferase